MELLEGETLRRRLEECLLFVRRATDFEVQIANGLAAAHAKANSCSRSRREESPRREKPRAAGAKPGADEPEERNPSEAGVATVWLAIVDAFRTRLWSAQFGQGTADGSREPYRRSGTRRGFRSPPGGRIPRRENSKSKTRPSVPA
jgi:hypothetical protein